MTALIAPAVPLGTRTARSHLRFFASQAMGQGADAITAVIVARALLTGDGGGVVDARSLLQTLAVAMVPYAVVGPVAGAIADRWNRRRTLGIAHLARAGLTLAAIGAVLSADRTSGLVVTALLLSGARIVYAVRAASLPWIADTGALVGVDARALRVAMVAAIVGAGSGGWMAAAAPALGLSIAAALQLAAAIGFGGLPGNLGGRTEHTTAPRVLRSIGHLVTSSPTRFMVAVTTSSRALLGACFATFVLLACDDYGLGANGYFLALAVTGLGSYLGAVVAAPSHLRLGPGRVVAAAHIVPAVGLIAAAAIDAMLPIALCVSFCAFQVLRVVADSTVQAGVCDESRGRVFSAYDVAYNLSYFGGAAVAITLDFAGSPRSAFLAIGAAFGTSALLLLTVRGTLAPIRARRRP